MDGRPTWRKKISVYKQKPTSVDGAFISVGGQSEELKWQELEKFDYVTGGLRRVEITF